MTTAAFVVVASCGLAALGLGAAGPRPELVEPGRDPLTVAYLGALVDRRPDDDAMRLRLGREQLALGRLADAEHTLAPLAARRAPDAERMALEVSLAAWRAARAGTAERTGAEARVLARVASLAQRSADLDMLARATAAARELGRPDLAARAGERAATVDRDRCATWLAASARDFLAAADPASAAASRRRAYDCADDGAAHALALVALDAEIAADHGAEALRFAEGLLARFPDDRELLARSESLAVAGGDAGRARSFAARLDELGAADDAMLARLFDLDLAAGDLPAALRTAQRRLHRAPAEPRLHRLLAHVAGWAGQPRMALSHWSWLARRGDGDGRHQALQLAHALDDDAAVVELLEDAARSRSLAAPALAELVAALERRGSPERAAALLEDAARSSPDEAAWERLAAFHERRRDLAAAITARAEIAQRHGASLSRSLQLARLAWAAGRTRAALSELARWSEVAGPAEHEYWQLLAELAWEQESDELAERAYRTIWQDGAIDRVGAERLIVLAREAGRSREAIRYGREGWARLDEPRLLLLAMDGAAHAGRWDEVAELRRRAVGDDRFDGVFDYWMLCAQLDQRRGRPSDAARAYRRALAIDAGSAAARSGLIWLFLDGNDRNRLAAVLGEWAAEAESDPGLWHAYAAGLERLGRSREALAFYRRDAEADPDDVSARARHVAAVHRAAPPRAVAAPAAPAALVTAELGATSLGSVMVRRFGLAARTGVRGVELELRSVLTQLSDSAMPRPGRSAVDLLAGAATPALGGRAEILGGASVLGDGAVAKAALAYTRLLAPRAQVRVEAAVNDAAPESAALLAEALRTRAGGSFALGSARFYGRIAAEAKTWSTRSGTWLGRGGAGTLELGARLRLADPEVTVRLQGGYQRNEVAAMLDAPLLPEELSTLGIGAGAAHWRIGPTRILVDAWLGWIAPPRRIAYRMQSGLAIPVAGVELSLAGHVANDSWVIGRGELGLTATLAYRFSAGRSSSSSASGSRTSGTSGSP